jgi:sec-independent protein translocase protein TatC
MLLHLLELRRRILQILSIFLIMFFIFFIFAPHLFHAIIMPLLQVLPTPTDLIATRITTPLLTPITLAADAALICTTPIALFHFWRFTAPGLYRRERHRLGSAMIVSFLLFLTGMLFGFYIVLPIMFAFFAKAVPMNVHLMPDMAYAVDFITRMLLTFAICFQVPLLCLILVRSQLLSLSTLTHARPYVIVSAFIIGMLLTPPDVLSQIMLALPICLLYELGIIVARLSCSEIPFTLRMK